MIRIEKEVEVTNFLMDQKFKLVVEPDKINGCLGRLLKRIETLIKRRILSKIEVQMKRIISLPQIFARFILTLHSWLLLGL